MAENQNRLTKFWKELKRRKALGVPVVYTTTTFILIQLVPLLEEVSRFHSNNFKVLTVKIVHLWISFVKDLEGNKIKRRTFIGFFKELI